MTDWCNKYCCEDMELAVESWGGVWWDEDKLCWFIEKEAGGKLRVKKITRCIWCDMPLPLPPESEE